MAQCVQSVQEFVQDSFVPMVAVLCSEEADRVTRKNNLNFAELLRPFCRLTSEGHIRDPNNQVQVVKNLRICVNKVVTSEGTTSAALNPAQRLLLNEVVLSCQPQEGAVTNVMTTGDYELNFSDDSLKASLPWYSVWRDTLLEINTSKYYTATTPWFEAYRENFLQSMPAADHEFLNHYLACLLVVSSTEAVPVEQFLKLSQEQHRIQHSGEYTNPKWFIPNTLKYYVLLHDTSEGDEQRADAVYEDMKQRYGPQGCYLLKMNSRTFSAEKDEQIPDPWSQYLHKNILRNQDTFDDLAPTVNSAAVENNMSAADVDCDYSTEKDGVSGSLENHALQLDTANSSGSLNTLSAVNTDLKKGARDPDVLVVGAGSHGACLTLNDHDHIRQFVQEFTFRGLLPHLEKNIRQLNDQLVSRKGLSRSLFTATKKWFGGGKVPEKNISEPKSTCGLLYPPEAPELQIRKMADLCFLVQHYELAYSCYHTAKKDFLSDQAMLYAAGALEMAAVSAFLQGGAPRPYPAHYMDTAIQTYKDVCKNMVLAERCALLSAEILKSQGKYSDAATLLIKMTSEDSDLRSALLLEQAAHCFINMRNPMVRKFAFHMILAGHRFSKAGQRRHALRCYCQAMQVYKDRGWSLAEDHINFTIGRQSFTLRQPDNAVIAFRQILINDSRQTATQQGAFLREYLYVYKSVIGASDISLPQLPLPCINSSATRVYFGHERRLAEGEKQAATHVSLDQEYDQDSSAMWCHLEEQLVASVNRGIVPANFQPTQYCLNNQTDNLRHPLAVVEEPIIVEVTFKNPLKVSLALSNLSLLWKFSSDGTSSSKETKTEDLTEETITNEETTAVGRTQIDDCVTTEIIQEFHMSPEETKMARLRLLPHRTGQLNIVGVVYNLAAASIGDMALSTEGHQTLDLMVVRGRQNLKILGPRLNLTKEDKMLIRHGPDRRLDPIITPPMPLMEVFFLQFPTALLCGEIRKAYVEFCNVSGVALCGLRVASTHPDFFTFGSQATTPLTPISPNSAENCSAYKTLATALQPGSVASEVLVSADDFSQPSGVIEIPIDGNTLQSGESTQLPLWLRGPDEEGVHEINFLFYYESTEKGLKISHRVLRHTVFICASRSLSVQASACRSSVPPHHCLDDKGSGGTLVFVDVENINTSEGGVREFHIVQVSSSSQHWRLHKYINPDKDKDCKLSSRERAKLCFRATRCKPHQATSDAVEKYTFADLNLGNERIISSSTPCGDFFFRCCRIPNSQQVDGASSRTSSIGKSQGSLPTEDRGSDITNIVKKCNELDLNIIIIWKAYVVEDNKQLILEGQLHVALQTIGKEASSLTPKEEAQEMVLLKFKSELPPPVVLPCAELSQLIKTNLHYPETYTHPFVQDSLCLVPVTLTLSNCSLAQVDVIIDLKHKSSSPESLEVHSSFAWVGQTQYKLQLKPQEVLGLSLQACFLRAGVYNLNTPQVFAKPSEQSAMCETSQQTASPALIIINNTCDACWPADGTT
ncbi:trafficking protein particle complex subunit 8 isoform X2 [Amphiprion ocellaris]|uniref:trafficking protein particle complex subunit 8 isoform X2 n=1 Tax=Amphiprion ocellaris TaxID=80972 RepID=UPI000C3014C7|nr:trafficking protein particle complex subunit 8 isoform X2 [Amphiprion ocellaris]